MTVEKEKIKVNVCKPFGIAYIKTLENWRNTCFESEDKGKGSEDINVFVAFFHGSGNDIKMSLGEVCSAIGNIIIFQCRNLVSSFTDTFPFLLQPCLTCAHESLVLNPTPLTFPFLPLILRDYTLKKIFKYALVCVPHIAVRHIL